MSMRLPRSNKNININSNSGTKRGSWGSKPTKVVVDEIDDIPDFAIAIHAFKSNAKFISNSFICY